MLPKIPETPLYASVESGGLKHELGCHIPPNVQVQYVCSSGRSNGDPAYFGSFLRPSVKSAMRYCRAGKGDVIVVLPGHEENIDSAWAANLVAGTVIIGLGDPRKSNAPKFTFDAVASTVDVDVDDVTIANCKFIAGANNITLGFDVNAAGFKFIGNLVDLGTTAALHFATFMNFAAESANCTIASNEMIGKIAITNAILVGAACDGIRILNNDIRGITGAVGTGLISVTAAATNIDIRGNRIHHALASSTAAINFADVAATGFCSDNQNSVEAAGSATNGIVLAGTSNILVHFFGNATSGADKGVQGLVSPAVET